jgi:anti-sigma regulatory factor (Ser/Thr protein kinase)
MRAQLRTGGVSEAVIDDAVLILSELLSNACKHGRPLGDALAGDGDVRAAWRVDGGGRLTVEVTDGGGPTRPAPATPSVTAHGGRGLNIITALADDWGVRNDARGEVTVWVVVHDVVDDDVHDFHEPDAGHRHDDFDTRSPALGFARAGGPPGPAGRSGPPGPSMAPSVSAIPEMAELNFADAFDEPD